MSEPRNLTPMFALVPHRAQQRPSRSRPSSSRRSTIASATSSPRPQVTLRPRRTDLPSVVFVKFSFPSIAICSQHTISFDAYTWHMTGVASRTPTHSLDHAAHSLFPQSNSSQSEIYEISKTVQRCMSFSPFLNLCTFVSHLKSKADSRCKVKRDSAKCVCDHKRIHVREGCRKESRQWEEESSWGSVIFLHNTAQSFEKKDACNMELSHAHFPQTNRFDSSHCSARTLIQASSFHDNLLSS